MGPQSWGAGGGGPPGGDRWCTRVTDQQTSPDPDPGVTGRRVPLSAHIAAWLAVVAFGVALAFMAWGASSR